MPNQEKRLISAPSWAFVLLKSSSSVPWAMMKISCERGKLSVSLYYDCHQESLLVITLEILRNKVIFCLNMTCLIRSFKTEAFNIHFSLSKIISILRSTTNLFLQKSSICRCISRTHGSMVWKNKVRITILKEHWRISPIASIFCILYCWMNLMWGVLEWKLIITI